MVRRTISVPEVIDETVREIAREDEATYSATVVRLIEAGTRSLRKGRRLDWVGSVRGGPRDWGRQYERYMRELTDRVAEDARRR